MVAKKTGISRDLIIHPGETIAEVLEDRGITQVDLAISTGVSPAYVSNVIAGKKDISAKFANALEYALDVPKTFWLNLQANYDAECLEANETNTITDEEREASESLKDVVKYLRQKDRMPLKEQSEESILSLRRALKVSNVTNLKALLSSEVTHSEQFRGKDYLYAAWIRLCQLSVEKQTADRKFSADNIGALVKDIKKIMVREDADVVSDLISVFSRYGIEFNVMKRFSGVSAQGCITSKKDGTYQLVVSTKDTYADTFWFSVFHELGHIVNGDINKGTRFVDTGECKQKELAANGFAYDKLMPETDYLLFVGQKKYDIEVIRDFASKQGIMPYMVVARLQKEKLVDRKQFEEYRLKYEWAE